jgi:DNA-binding response OmpR family regulator
VQLHWPGKSEQKLTDPSPHFSHSTPPAPCKVLIVEDETLIAMLVEDMLVDLGYEVLGPATRLQRALEMAREESFDVALLDINLASEQSFPVALVLRERGIPFIFATGYGSKGLDERFRDEITLQKPFEMRQLEQAIFSALGSAQSDGGG